MRCVNGTPLSAVDELRRTVCGTNRLQACKFRGKIKKKLTKSPQNTLTPATFNAFRNPIILTKKKHRRRLNNGKIYAVKLIWPDDDHVKTKVDLLSNVVRKRKSSSQSKERECVADFILSRTQTHTNACVGGLTVEQQFITVLYCRTHVLGSADSRLRICRNSPVLHRGGQGSLLVEPLALQQWKLWIALFIIVWTYWRTYHLTLKCND